VGTDAERGASSQASEVEAMIACLVDGSGRHPAKDSNYRERLARAVTANAQRHGIPVELVVAIIFRESSCRKDLIGPGGERGLMQNHPYTIRMFKCDMSTAAGQVACGCEVLAWHHDRCNSDWRAALAAYGSRKATCNPKRGTRLRRMVNDRFRLAAKLRQVVSR